MVTFESPGLTTFCECSLQPSIYLRLSQSSNQCSPQCGSTTWSHLQDAVRLHTICVTACCLWVSLASVRLHGRLLHDGTHCANHFMT